MFYIHHNMVYRRGGEMFVSVQSNYSSAIFVCCRGGLSQPVSAVVQCLNLKHAWDFQNRYYKTGGVSEVFAGNDSSMIVRESTQL